MIRSRLKPAPRVKCPHCKRKRVVYVARLAPFNMVSGCRECLHEMTTPHTYVQSPGPIGQCQVCHSDLEADGNHLVRPVQT